LVLLGASVAVGVFGYLTAETLKQYGTLERDEIVLRVIVSNVSVLSQFKSIPLHWPSVALGTMSAGSLLGDPVSMLNLECLLRSSVPHVFVSALVALATPILLFGILCAVFGVVEYRNRRHWRKHVAERRRDSQASENHFAGDVFTAAIDMYAARRLTDKLRAERRRKRRRPRASGILSTESVVTPWHMFQSSLVTMAYFLYPSLLKNCFGLLDCAYHEQAGPKESCFRTQVPDRSCTRDGDCDASLLCLDNGLCGTDLNSRKLYFRADPSVECFDGRHGVWLAALFAPALIAFCLGIPIVFSYHIRKYRKLIVAGGGPKRATWGFVTSGFKQNLYFWELVIFSRKFSMIFIVVFASRFGPRLACVLGILTLTTFLMAHVKFLPYEDDVIDGLESFSLITNVFTIAIALLFDRESAGSDSHVFWLVVLFAVNISFFAHAARVYWSHVKVKVTEKVTTLTKAVAKRITRRLTESAEGQGQKKGTGKGTGQVKEEGEGEVAVVEGEEQLAVDVAGGGGGTGIVDEQKRDVSSSDGAPLRNKYVVMMTPKGTRGAGVFDASRAPPLRPVSSILAMEALNGTELT
jgi:hypothetical protein